MDLEPPFLTKIPIFGPFGPWKSLKRIFRALPVVGGVYISENTPYKSIISFLLSYYTTSLDDPFGFCEDWHKIAQFWHILRNISKCSRYAKLHEPDSDYLDPIDEISEKKSPAYLETQLHKRSDFTSGLFIILFTMIKQHYKTFQMQGK